MAESQLTIGGPVRSRETAVRLAEVRRVAPFRFRDAGDGEPGDGNTMDGYASVFNSETIIDSWEGRFKEQFLSGSMKKSFRAQTPLIQFDHGRHPMIGSLPVAAFRAGYPIEETDPERAPDGGAHVVADLHQSPIFEPVREVISTGTVNGMSIRFAPVREKWYWPDGRPVRNDAEIQAELYRTWVEDVPDEELLRRDVVEAMVAEMGPVVWPAYVATSVGVRSLLVTPDEDPTPNIDAAPEAERTGGDEDDAERQAAEASRKNERAKQVRGLSLRRL
jgi:phage head maturation protease